MAGNLNKAEARARLEALGLQPRGLALEEAALYVGVSPQLFLRQVAAGELPKPRQFGRRKVWDRIALDRTMSGEAASSDTRRDPIMESIDAAKSA
jgi:predicted DNA-binding transcriptional regulator AlpA